MLGRPGVLVQQPVACAARKQEPEGVCELRASKATIGIVFLHIDITNSLIICRGANRQTAKCTANTCPVPGRGKREDVVDNEGEAVNGEVEESALPIDSSAAVGSVVSAAALPKGARCCTGFRVVNGKCVANG